tara:strand:+ start:829 stop:1149 length:321 start_codon:yes stop_codon:yes gene_type:complete
MNKMFFGSLLGVLIAGPTFADDAVSFGNFLGVALAIEDACPQYYVLTAATSGGHLDGKDYQYAMSLVEQSRERATGAIVVLGCDDAAREAAKMVDMSFFEVWEVRQ